MRGAKSVGAGNVSESLSLEHDDPMGSTLMWLKVSYAAYAVGYVKVTSE
jgi:hypothetical protein